MNKAISKGITVGRPFGGVGFLWHCSLNSIVQFVSSDVDGRCIVIKLNLNNTVYIIFNVYFPCYSDSSEYRDEISSLTGYIENILSNNSFEHVVILGDTNFDLNFNNAGFNIFNSLLNSAGLCAFDDLVQGPIVNTYYNEALRSPSRIDHFFVSIALKPFIGQVCIIESSCNFSDHRPISMNIALPRSQQVHMPKPQPATAKLS